MQTYEELTMLIVGHLTHGHIPKGVKAIGELFLGHEKLCEEEKRKKEKECFYVASSIFYLYSFML